MSRTRQSTAERIAEEISTAIQANEYAPGTRLREEELATHFGTSRGPVREALRLLSASSWVELDPGKGASVRKRSETDALDDYHLRKSLFGVAARLATERATPQDLESIEQIAREIAIAAPKDISPTEFRLMTFRAGNLLVRTAKSKKLHELFNVLDRGYALAGAKTVLNSPRQRIDAARLWVDLAIACRMRDANAAGRLAEALYERGLRESMRSLINADIFEVNDPRSANPK